MTDTPSGESFKPLTLPRKKVSDLLHSRYRVYSDADNYVLVEAPSALAAFRASGLPQARRIERDAMFFNTLMKNEPDLKPPVPEPAAAPAVPEAAVPDQAAAAETLKPEPPVTPPPEEAAAPAEQAAAAAPLSNAEVDKLLQG